MEVHGQLLESRADPSALLQPPDALLDHRALPVRLSVNRTNGSRRACSLSLVRDDRLDPVQLTSRERAGRCTPCRPRAAWASCVAGASRGDEVATTDSRRVLSCTRPFTSTASGTPAPSVTRWNFDQTRLARGPARGRAARRVRSRRQPRPRRGLNHRQSMYPAEATLALVRQRRSGRTPSATATVADRATGRRCAGPRRCRIRRGSLAGRPSEPGCAGRAVRPAPIARP